eukprot:TRINITY_DN1031_c0_g1_i1.p2 TRINITY_DN1031_c0_g1~~TRINITY_DN1031_c0_g1_i1.p2  ORF type:complete len:86 (-),score=6.95 TRINITY_DN1031_c0_g1_i1:361-618(-)
MAQQARHLALPVEPEKLARRKQPNVLIASGGRTVTMEFRQTARQENIVTAVKVLVQTAKMESIVKQEQTILHVIYVLLEPSVQMA